MLVMDAPEWSQVFPTYVGVSIPLTQYARNQRRSIHALPSVVDRCTSPSAAVECNGFSSNVICYRHSEKGAEFRNKKQKTNMGHSLAAAMPHSSEIMSRSCNRQLTTAETVRPQFTRTPTQLAYLYAYFSKRINLNANSKTPVQTWYPSPPPSSICTRQREG